MNRLSLTASRSLDNLIYVKQHTMQAIGCQSDDHHITMYLYLKISHLIFPVHQPLKMNHVNPICI